MGHESCGAVTAAINGGNNGYNLNHLLSHITPAIAASKSKKVNAVVKKNAQLTAKELVERSPIIAKADKRKTFKVVPAYYNLGSGKVDF